MFWKKIKVLKYKWPICFAKERGAVKKSSFWIFFSSRMKSSCFSRPPPRLTTFIVCLYIFCQIVAIYISTCPYFLIKRKKRKTVTVQFTVSIFYTGRRIEMIHNYTAAICFSDKIPTRKLKTYKLCAICTSYFFYYMFSLIWFNFSGRNFVREPYGNWILQ